jgi:hypothetical protein
MPFVFDAACAYDNQSVAPGAQTSRPGDAWPVGRMLGGKAHRSLLSISRQFKERKPFPYPGARSKQQDQRA